MKHNKYINWFVAVSLVFLCSCDDTVTIDNSIDYQFPIIEGATLKQTAVEAGFPIGVGIDYAPYMNDAQYAGIVHGEFDNVTFGYEMKHGAVVNNQGDLNFTKSDAMFNKLTTAGIGVYGHTLVWHQNNNRAYLNSLVQLKPSAKVNEIANGTFEAGISGWSRWNGASPVALSHVTGGNNYHSGNGGMQIVNDINHPTSPWSTQIHTDFTNPDGLKEKATYTLTFWIRSTSGNGEGRCSTTGSNPQYQNNFTTSETWKEIKWTFKAEAGAKGLNFDMGAIANTYIIDDVELSEVLEDTGSINEETVRKNKEAVDNAMKNWIFGMAGHYKGKVKAWDVVNEPMSDGNGSVRSGEAPKDTLDVFYWQYFLGRDYAVNAFKYAATADPDALLFINDYNLEINAAKLDSLINYVKELKAKGAKIDGIGTQVHINWNSYTGIDNMFKKLAATGLKIKVTELDVKLNPNKSVTYQASESDLNFQAVMYKMIVESYIRNVPPAQRYGITVWGITDADSWIKNDNPCLWNKDYGEKPAYGGFMQGLKYK